MAIALPALLSACSSLPGSQPLLSPAPASQPALPAYVYPPDPPLVGAEELRGLLVRLDARKTIIWAFNNSPSCSAVAATLADHRDALRVQETVIVGLFTGPPTDWLSRAVPMLRTAGANFPCAVLDPGRQSPVSVWLAQRPGEPPAGLYVMAAQTRRVVFQASQDENSVREWLDQLSTGQWTATRPASDASSQPEGVREVNRAEIRLVDLGTGQTLVRAEGRADQPARLARILGEQLVTAVMKAPRVAVLPFRESARSRERSGGLGLAVAEQLGRYLAAGGWPQLVQAPEASQILTSLELNPMSVEFNPGLLQGQTPWQAIVVGTVSAETP